MIDWKKGFELLEEKTLVFVRLLVHEPAIVMRHGWLHDALPYR